MLMNDVEVLGAAIGSVISPSHPGSPCVSGLFGGRDAHDVCRVVETPLYWLMRREITNPILDQAKYQMSHTFEASP